MLFRSVNEAYRTGPGHLPLAEVLDWSAEDRDRVLRGSAARRATLDMWRRNAIVCIANVWRRDESSVTTAMTSRMDRIRADETESPIVREAARRALRAIGSGP